SALCGSLRANWAAASIIAALPRKRRRSWSNASLMAWLNSVGSELGSGSRGPSSHPVDPGKVDQLGGPPIEHGFQHEQAEVPRLGESGLRRHDQFLSRADDVDQRRSAMAEGRAERRLQV